MREMRGLKAKSATPMVPLVVNRRFAWDDDEDALDADDEIWDDELEAADELGPGAESKERGSEAHLRLLRDSTAVRALGISPGELERHPLHPLKLAVEAAAPPEAPAALLQWAEQQGLSSALAAPASGLEWWMGLANPDPALRQVTLRDCLAGRKSARPKDPLRRWPQQVLLHAARHQVAHLAHRARLEELRRSLWAEAPPAPLDSLSGLLRSLYEQLQNLPECRERVSLTESGLLVREDPPHALGFFPEGWGPPVRTQIIFVGRADGRLSVSCTCRRAPHCRHLRVLLEVLLDAIHGGGALAAELAELLAVPDWQRLMSALAVVRRVAETEPRERLAWRLGPSPQGLSVQPALQQRNARGQWSSGRKLEPQAAARRRRDAAPEDRAPLDAYIAAQYLESVCGPLAGQLPLLEALIDHPRVIALEAPHEPLRVARARAQLCAALEDGQLELGVQVAGRRVALDGLLAALVDQHSGVWFEPGAAWLFELPSGAYPVLATLARYEVKLPRESHGHAAELLTSLSEHVPIELPEALRGRALSTRPLFVLRLLPRGPQRLGAELRVRLHAEPSAGAPAMEPLGADLTPGRGALDVSGSAGGERVWTRRNLEQEAAQARAITEQLGLEAAAEGWCWQLDGDAALDLVQRARAVASAPERAIVVEWPESPAWQTQSFGPRHLRVRVERLGEWFSIGGSLAVDGFEVSLAALLGAARSGQRFIELGSGRFARIEAELASVASRIDDLSHPHAGQRVLGPAAIPALAALELPQLDCAAEWSALWQRIDAARQLDPELPSALRAELRPYQHEGYRWLARLSAWDAGCCLADDMGLGKTVQCLSLLLSRPGPHLVVAPTSVGPNWLREAQSFAPSLRTRLYRGADRTALLSDLAPGDLLVASYDLLALDAGAFAGIEFDTLVLDEAQAVKNARTRRARAARELRARFKLALTGTPIENHLGELWSIFSILSPGLLGPWEHFRDRFAAPIERDGNRARLEALSRLVRPFLLRRTKANVAPELPPRTQVIEPVELSAAERVRYEVSRREALSALNDLTSDERGRIQILAELTRLRRLACHPKLLDGTYRGPSSKLETLLRIISELRESGQRALIFSQFTSFLAFVREAFDARGIVHLYLDGQTPLGERSRLVDAWRARRADFFLLSLKAGGSGLNLVGADAVIHLDPWWNPAVEDQATDRTHRIGQERPVTAIRLIAQGTIEEAVIALHDEKRSLADGLLEGTEAAARLSSADLVDLIRFGEGAPSAPPDPEETASAFPEPDAPAPAPRHRRKSDPAPEAGVELDAEALLRLRQRLQQRLRREDLLDETVRSYLRAFDKLLELARQTNTRCSLESWRKQCVAALREGTLQGPRNLPSILSVVVRRAAELRAN
jgi:hypothetical protein